MQEPEAPERGDRRLAGVIAAVVFLLALTVGLVTFAVVDRRSADGVAAIQAPELPMSAFGDTLSAQQIQDVAAYVTQRVATGR